MSDINSKTVRDVIVPLSVDEIKNFFTNKDIIYFVNYAKSELKGVVFLTYLSNLDLPAEINFEGATYEQKAELFKIYLTTRNIIKSDTLRLNIAKILLDRKGVTPSDMFYNLAFNEKEAASFTKENIEILDRWERFLESTILYAYTTLYKFNEKINIIETVENVNDPSYVGANIVNLFSVPSFLEFFYAGKIKHKLAYFKHQFEDYMFRGKNLYSYYRNPMNTTYGLLLSVVHDDITNQQLEVLSQIVEEKMASQGEANG